MIERVDKWSSNLSSILNPSCSKNWETVKSKSLNADITYTHISLGLDGEIDLDFIAYYYCQKLHRYLVKRYTDRLVALCR